MKWKNKGHEFDEAGGFFAQINTINLFGAGEIGAALYRDFAWMGVEDTVRIRYIDNDVDKQGSLHCGCEVISPQEMMRTWDERQLIVVCASAKNTREIMAELAKEVVLSVGENLFTHLNWKNRYLSIFMLYKYDILYHEVQQIIITTVCNLNCRGCLNFTEYIQHKKHDPLEYILEGIDAYFMKFDFVVYFHISGGEPFLHPDLPKIVRHVGERYRDRIRLFQVTTNGTLVPTDELMDVAKVYDCIINLDDYRETVPSRTKLFSPILRRLDEKGVRRNITKLDHWIDLAPKTTDHSWMAEADLVQHFDACDCPYTDVRGGRLYSCSYACFAIKAGLVKETEDDYIELSNASKKEVLEARLRYTERGYMEFCKHCAGFLAINKNFIPPALQVGEEDV